MPRFSSATVAALFIALGCQLPADAQTTASQWLSKAKQCAYNGDEQGVSDACNAAVQLEPKNVEAWNLLADSNLPWALANPTKAKKYYSQVLALDPKNYHALAFRGYVSIADNTRASKSDLQQSIAILKALPNRTTEQERVYAMASFWLDPKSCLPVVQRAAELNPEDTEAIYFLACTLDALGRTDEAKSCFKKDQTMVETELKKHFNGALGRQIVRFCATLQNYPDGIEMLSSYLKKHPDDVNALYYRGYALTMDRQLEQALKDYSKSASLGPTYQYHSMVAADAESAHKNYREAARIFKRLMTSEPSSEVYINKRALCLKELKMNALAIQEINRYLANYPNAYTVWKTKAELEATTELERADRQQALNKISQAIDNAPELAPLYVLRCSMYQDTGEPKKALADIDQSIRLKPDESSYYQARAVLKWNRLDLRDAAIADLIRAVELALPQTKRAYLLILSDYYKMMEQYDKAIEAANKSIAVSPEIPDGYRQRALVHMAQGRFQQALTDLQKALAVRSGQDDLDLLIARTYVRLNKPKEALTAFNTSLNKDQQNLEARLERGALHAKMEQYDLALADFEKVVLMSPQNSEVYYARSRAYAAMGEYMKAITDLSKSMELSNRNNESWLLEDRARLYTYAERYNEAAEDLAKAYRFALNKPVYLFQRGKLLYWSGNKQGAIGCISAYLRLVTDPLALRARARCYFETDQLDLSIRDYSTLIQADPENPALYRLRAKSYAKQGREQLATADLNTAKLLMKSR